MQKERNTSIDGLKGLGIIGIFFLHYCQHFPTGILRHLDGYANSAVQLMFLINGFLTAASLESFSKSGSGIVKWYGRKLLRIYPQYLLFTVIAILFVTVNIRRIDIGLNLLLLEGFFPESINSVNINWFIADIAIWYLIAPAVCRLCSGVKRTALCLMAYVPAYWLFVYLISKNVSDEIYLWYFSYGIIFGQLSCMLVGVLVYHLIREYKEHEPGRAELISAIFVTAMMLIGAYLGMVIFDTTTTYAVIYGILLWCLLKKPVRLIAGGILPIIGKYSYGIYLSHHIIITLILRFLESEDIHISLWMSPICFAVLFVVTLGVAVLAGKLQMHMESLILKRT